MPLTARPVTPASAARRSASHERVAVAGGPASSRPTVVSPMPRLGTLSTRLTDTSSAGFTTAFR